MKLNKECIRDLLLFIEDANFNETLFRKDFLIFCDEKNYDEDEVIYTIQKLKEANFIKGFVQYASNQVYAYGVSSLTYKGHEFLDTVRDPKVWSLTKEAISGLASVTIPIISQVAMEIIKKKLGL